MNKFAVGDLIAFKTTPDAPDHETLTGTVVAVGIGVLTVQLPDGSKVGITVDETVRRIEPTAQEANAVAESGQNEAIRSDSQTAENARKNGSEAVIEPMWSFFADPLDEGPLPDDKQLVWIAKNDGSVFIYNFSVLAAPWAMINAVAWMPAVKPAPPVVKNTAFSTAAQRAEAACRALGIWQESETQL